MERQQLLPKGQIFDHEVLTRLEGANRPAEKLPEPRHHGENIDETSPTELNSQAIDIADVRSFDDSQDGRWFHSCFATLRSAGVVRRAPLFWHTTRTQSSCKPRVNNRYREIFKMHYIAGR